MMTIEEQTEYIARVQKEMELCKSDREVLALKESVAARFQQERMEMLAECQAMEKEFAKMETRDFSLENKLKRLTARLQTLNKESKKLEGKLEAQVEVEPRSSGKTSTLKDRLRRKLEAREKQGGGGCDLFVGYQWKKL
jgi:monoamine oxidase